MDGSQVAPGDDDTLMRICARPRASVSGTARCQKSSHTGKPSLTPAAIHGSEQIARAKEPPFIEQTVGGQEQLAAG